MPVRPVKGQILRLRARAGAPLPAARVVRTPEVYAVPRADGRLVVGATVEEQGFDMAVTAGGVLELLRRAYEALPGISELELVEARAGLRPAAPDNGPIVGRERGGRARLGDRALAQRDPARADHRARRSRRCSPETSRLPSSRRSRRGASPTAPPEVAR